MQKSTRVHVIKYPDRENLVMRYRCPFTRKQVTRSTGTKSRREAERIAAKWEADIHEGRYEKDSRIGWEEFRLHWEESKATTLKPTTATDYNSTLNAFEEFCRPERLLDLTTQSVSTFASALRRSRGLTEASVARHLRSLKAIARWANGQGLLHKLPSFDMPNGALRPR